MVLKPACRSLSEAVLPQRQVHGGVCRSAHSNFGQVYRQAGQEREARQMAIARRTACTATTTSTARESRATGCWTKTIRHDDQPLGAVGLLLVIWGAQHQDKRDPAGQGHYLEFRGLG
jgi:hypothetical protein